MKVVPRIRAYRDRARARRELQWRDAPVAVHGQQLKYTAAQAEHTHLALVL